jgi:hypothetical protein
MRTITPTTTSLRVTSRTLGAVRIPEPCRTSSVDTADYQLLQCSGNKPCYGLFLEIVGTLLFTYR